MKTLTLLAAIAAAFTVSAPAFAQDTTTPVETHKAHSASAEAGHWEWQSQPSYGPRAPLRAPKRVWVPAASETAAKDDKAGNCDCGMMHASAGKAADCMKMDKSAS